MVQDINGLLDDGNLRDEMGNNGRKYVEQGHDIQKIITEFTALFQDLTGVGQP
jgi:glycosyltransferase involved in cell wall biosynthesis